MRWMKLKEFRPVARAYGLSIAVWCGLSLLTGVQYRVFDKKMNINSSLLDMLLAESRDFSFALLTAADLLEFLQRVPYFPTCDSRG